MCHASHYLVLFYYTFRVISIDVLAVIRENCCCLTVPRICLLYRYFILWLTVQITDDGDDDDDDDDDVHSSTVCRL